MKVPVLHIVIAAYGTLLARPAQFVAATIPALVMIAALWGLLLVSGRPEAVVWHLWLIVDLLPYIVFGLIWLRLLLHDSSLLARPLVGRRGVFYAVIGGLFCLLLWLPVIDFLPLGVVTFLEAGETGWRLPEPEGAVYLVGLALLPPWSYLFARMSLLVPAAASAQPLTLCDAWRATKGNGLRLMAAYLLAGLPLLTVGLAVYVTSVDSWHPSVGFILWSGIVDLLSALLRLAAVAVFVAVLAEAYRLLPGAPSAHNQVRLRFE